MTDEKKWGGELAWMHSAPAARKTFGPRNERMRIGASEVFTGEPERQRQFAIDAAQTLEGLGFDTLWMPEQVIHFPVWESKYPYGSVGAADVSRERKEEGNEGVRGQFDSIMTACALAQVTNRIRFGSFVVILPQRNPFVFAREVATADHLTGGRISLGVGIGWALEEYRALGIPPERRGERMNEYLEVLRILWTTDLSEYHGDFVECPPILAYPKPLQSPHPPILVGGQSKRSIARAAKLGDGLLIYALGIDDIKKVLEVYSEELDGTGKTLESQYVVVGRRNEGRTQSDWDDDAQFIEECRQLGVISEVACSQRFPTEGYEGYMRRYAATIGLPGAP